MTLSSIRNILELILLISISSSAYVLSPYSNSNSYSQLREPLLSPCYSKAGAREIERENGIGFLKQSINVAALGKLFTILLRPSLLLPTVRVDSLSELGERERERERD